MFDNDDECRHAVPSNAQPKIAFHFSDFSKSDKEKLKNLSVPMAVKEELIVAREGNEIGGYQILIDNVLLEISVVEDEQEAVPNTVAKEKEEEIPAEEDQTSTNGESQGEGNSPPAEAGSDNGEETQDDEPPKPPKRRKQPTLSDIQKQLIDELWDMLPKIEWFEDPPELPESVTLADLGGDSPKVHTAKKLLELAGVEKLSDLFPEGSATLIGDNYRDEISAAMTRLLSQFWTQDADLSIGLSYDKPNLRFKFDEATPRSTAPKHHSLATRIFIAILVDLRTRIGANGQNVILLLDEPGKLLHPGAQRDLLGLFRSLPKGHQIVYTSHFPYLIDKNYPGQVRLVGKSTQGTDITNKAHHTPHFYDLSYEPLRTALGVGMGDSLAFSEKNIIVEGASDQLIICGLSQEIAAAGSLGYLDLNDTSVIPAGSVNNIELVARLARMKNNDLKVIALFDSDVSGQKVYKRLLEKAKKHPENAVLKQHELISLAHVYAGGGRTQRAIEDLLLKKLYFDAVNRLYGKVYPDTWNDLDPTSDEFKDVAIPISNVLKEHFQNNEEFGDFDKVRVAKEVVAMLREKKVVKADGTPSQYFEKPVELVHLLRDAIDGTVDPAEFELEKLGNGDGEKSSTPDQPDAAPEVEGS